MRDDKDAELKTYKLQLEVANLLKKCTDEEMRNTPRYREAIATLLCPPSLRHMKARHVKLLHIESHVCAIKAKIFDSKTSTIKYKITWSNDDGLDDFITTGIMMELSKDGFECSAENSPDEGSYIVVSWKSS